MFTLSLGGLFLFVQLDLVQVAEGCHFDVLHLDDHELLGLDEGPQEIVHKDLVLMHQRSLFDWPPQHFTTEIPVLSQQRRQAIDVGYL